MKPVIISIVSLFLLSACTDEQDTEITYDIECQGKSDGWQPATNTITDIEGNIYQFDGEWHCKNQKLWYSEVEGEVNLFGRFYVDKIALDSQTTRYDYNFIQIDYAQNLVIQQNVSNESYNHNQYVESQWLTFNFLTDDGILPQLLTTAPYSGTNINSSNDCDSITNSSSNCMSFAIDYNLNSEVIANMSTTQFKDLSNDIYRFGNSACSGSNNQDWDCEHSDTSYYNDQSIEDSSYGDNTIKSQSLTPSVDKLFNNPLETRDELIRLSEVLFDY